jgi:hypothetical protein
MIAISGSQAKRGALAKLAAATVAALILTLHVAEAAWANQWFTCQPSAVAFYPKSRLHVKCSNPQNGIEYFAMKAKGKDAAMMLPLLTEAFSGGLNVAVLYDPNDLSGEKFGCLNADCRVLRGASMEP